MSLNFDWWEVVEGINEDNADILRDLIAAVKDLEKETESLRKELQELRYDLRTVEDISWNEAGDVS